MFLFNSRDITHNNFSAHSYTGFGTSSPLLAAVVVVVGIMGY